METLSPGGCDTGSVAAAGLGLSSFLGRSCHPVAECEIPAPSCLETLPGTATSQRPSLCRGTGVPGQASCQPPCGYFSLASSQGLQGEDGIELNKPTLITTPLWGEFQSFRDFNFKSELLLKVPRHDYGQDWPLSNL